MKYSVPYYFSELYLDFINQINKISSVYYSLKMQNIGDARYSDMMVTNKPSRNLLPPSNIDQYIVLNARFNNPNAYNNYDIDRLISIFEYYNITGIIFLDTYLLKLISKRSNNFIKQIDAIPSINMFLDTYQKCIRTVDYLVDIGFKKPSKLILDRSLNRNKNELENIYKKLNKESINVELLANEGCLYQCPYKINHDILISVSHFDNRSYHINEASNINSLFGCLDDYKNYPYKLLVSPFIRPQDVDFYESCADTIKIAGRINPEPHTVDIIRSYINKFYSGNLLDLNDSQGSLKDVYYLFTDLIPHDFLEVTANCDKRCNNCEYCKNIFDKISQKIG